LQPIPFAFAALLPNVHNVTTFALPEFDFVAVHQVNINVGDFLVQTFDNTAFKNRLLVN
jgi:hypothetical protein